MNRNEIENVLDEIFDEALNGEGLKYPVTIILKGEILFGGFMLLENHPNYIVGFTKEQKTYVATSPAFYSATFIMKDSIDTIASPAFDTSGIRRPAKAL